MRHRARITLVGTALVTVTSALTVLTTTAAQAAAPPTVNVSVSGTRVVHLPANVRPGLHRYAVKSAKTSSFEIVHPHAGYSKADFIKNYNSGGLAAFKSLEKHLTFRGGAFTDKADPAVFYANLGAGTYFAFDQAANTLSRAKVTTFKVGGSRVTGSLPSVAGTIKAIDTNTWAGSPTSISHAGVLRFQNSSKANHYILLSKLKAGKTIADFRQWLKDSAANPSNPPPSPLTATDFLTGVVGAGQHAWFKYSLPAGDYVLSSPWPDAANNGTPQVSEGMNRAITLS